MTVDVNLAIAFLVVIVCIVVSIVLGIRFGLGAAQKFVASLMTSPAFMAAFTSLEKSVPPEFVNTLLTLIKLGSSVATDPDLKALLDQIKALLEANGITLPANATTQDYIVALQRHTENVKALATSVNAGPTGFMLHNPAPPTNGEKTIG